MFCAGTVALREIRHCQRSTQPRSGSSLSSASSARLLKSSGSTCFPILCFQEALKTHLISLFEDTNLAAIHDKRVTKPANWSLFNTPAHTSTDAGEQRPNLGFCGCTLDHIAGEPRSVMFVDDKPEHNLSAHSLCLLSPLTTRSEPSKPPEVPSTIRLAYEVLSAEGCKTSPFWSLQQLHPQELCPVARAGSHVQFVSNSSPSERFKWS